MTKPKNPYPNELTDRHAIEWHKAYIAGLRDGERRLARTLRRWLGYWNWHVSRPDIERWLSARQKAK